MIPTEVKCYISEKQPVKRKRAADARIRRNSESSLDTEKRLEAARNSQARRLANESVEDREKRLAAIRDSNVRKFANESLEDRENRLEAMRKSKANRLANESMEDRENRLAAMRDRQVCKLANESFEDRLDRLCLYSDRRDAVRRVGHDNSPDQPNQIDNEQPGPAFPAPLPSCKLTMK